MKDSLTLEIDTDAFLNLLRQHVLSISDFRCLDKETKLIIHKSYLEIWRDKTLRDQMAKRLEKKRD